jgi:hypothetical protein
MKDSSRRLGALLNAVPALKAISVQLEDAARLQRALHAALPDNLAACASLVHCENGVALISASSAAAARLRMLAPRLTRTLREADARVREIRVIVDVSRQPAARNEPPRLLDETGMAAWRQLASSLPEGSLRQACRALVRKQETSDRQQEPLENQEGQDRRDDE